MDADTGLMTWAEVQQWLYLDAVIKEAFRLHTAAGLPLERHRACAGCGDLREIRARRDHRGLFVGSPEIFGRRPRYPTREMARGGRELRRGGKV